MTKFKRNALIIASSIFISSMAIAMAHVPSFSAIAETEPSAENAVQSEGISLRYGTDTDGITGLRFKFRIDSGVQVDDFVPVGAQTVENTYEYGMLIFPERYLEEGGRLYNVSPEKYISTMQTDGKGDYLNYLYTKYDEDSNNNSIYVDGFGDRFLFGTYNMSEVNYGRNFLAVAYWYVGGTFYSAQSEVTSAAAIAASVSPNVIEVGSHADRTITKYLQGCGHKNGETDGYCNTCHRPVESDCYVQINGQKIYPYNALVEVGSGNYAYYDTARKRIVLEVNNGFSVISTVETQGIDAEIYLKCDLSYEGTTLNTTGNKTVYLTGNGTTLTLNAGPVLKVETKTVIGTADRTLTVQNAGGYDGVQLFSELRVEKGSAYADTNNAEAWQYTKSAELKSGGSLTVAGSWTSPVKGIGIYFTEVDNSLAIGYDGVVNLTNTYGHGIASERTGNSVWNYGTLNISAPNAFLNNSNAMLLKNYEGATVVAKGAVNLTTLENIGNFYQEGNVNVSLLSASGGNMYFSSFDGDTCRTAVASMNDEGAISKDGVQTTGYTYRVANLLLYKSAQSVNFMNTLIADNVIVKTGELNVNINAARDSWNDYWGICTSDASADSVYHYYFLGGKTSVVNLVEEGEGSGALHVGTGHLVFATGRDAKIYAGKFLFLAHGNTSSAEYGFTKNYYQLKGDNSLKVGEAAEKWGIRGYDIWGTVSQDAYWECVGLNAQPTTNSAMSDDERNADIVWGNL